MNNAEICDIMTARFPDVAKELDDSQFKHADLVLLTFFDWMTKLETIGLIDRSPFEISDHGDLLISFLQEFDYSITDDDINDMIQVIMKINPPEKFEDQDDSFSETEALSFILKKLRDIGFAALKEEVDSM